MENLIAIIQFIVGVIEFVFGILIVGAVMKLYKIAQAIEKIERDNASFHYRMDIAIKKIVGNP